VARPGHLVSRFLGSLLPLGPSREDAAWALRHLSAAEAAVWRRMSNLDRRHAAGVARRAARSLGDQATTEVLAAALLHDSGKVVSRLGTSLRVVATVAAATVGRPQAEGWAAGRGVSRRLGLYLRHPQLGADLLAAAGSHPLTVAWAGEHHLPEACWSVPLAVGRALKAADDD
jgi:hypothetical protein